MSPTSYTPEDQLQLPSNAENITIDSGVIEASSNISTNEWPLPEESKNESQGFYNYLNEPDVQGTMAYNMDKREQILGREHANIPRANAIALGVLIEELRTQVSGDFTVRPK